VWVYLTATCRDWLPWTYNRANNNTINTSIGLVPIEILSYFGINVDNTGHFIIEYSVPSSNLMNFELITE
jgi:hypothetical protein